ncbi:MAG: BatD family protein [Candidatus Krumholzibacteria bacterium]|nr:BatD family protein [Candidatus Krumholzibacteria bacterium]
MKSLLCVVCVGLAAAFFCAEDAYAENISVQINVESRDVYMGESFLMQLVIDGSDKAGAPDLSSLEGFGVEFLGGSNNSSQSISIINGRIQRMVKKGFIFNYRLTPEKTGRLTIPSLTINVGGQNFATGAVTIAVRRPTETEDFKLRINLSREACYVGEPVVLTVTWYLRRDVEDFRFTMPILGNKDIIFEDPEIKIDKRKKYFRIAVGGGEVIAVKGQGILNGESYATLQFSKVLIPRRSGTFVIPEVVVNAEAVTGRRVQRDFFDNFFSDDFFGMRRGRLKKYVVPSNALSLRVRKLPAEGRPPGFSGHVGEYRILASAEPTEVNVGDPITLKIILEGPDYLGSVNLPRLLNQEDLAGDFKIPDERADGRIEGSRKVFTQTIRAKHDRVEEIPPIRLVYFDTKKGRYSTALSDPIPLVVQPTKVVTALDAEGIEPGPSGTPIEKWKEGIAYNYEGPDVIVPQGFGLGPALSDPAWLAGLVLPPAAYLIIFAGLIVVRRRRADPEARRARGALKRLRASLSVIGKDKELSQAQVCGDVMEALREYLGDKLRRTGSTLTTGDVEEILKRRGVARDVIEALIGVLGACEVGSYAGDLYSAEDREGLVERVKAASERLEKAL